MIHQFIDLFHHGWILDTVLGMGGALLLSAVYCMAAAIMDLRRPSRGVQEAQRAQAARTQIDGLYSSAHQRVVGEAMRHRRQW
jgi:hypothetical protein